MIWWPFVVFTWNILLSQCVFSVPVPYLPYWQLPQMPSGIQYIGNTPLSGGTPQSLLTANFAPNQIVTTSGMATNALDTGFPAFVDLIGSAFGDLGRALGGLASSTVGKVGLALSSLVSGTLGWSGMNTNVNTFSIPIGSNNNTPITAAPSNPIVGFPNPNPNLNPVVDVSNENPAAPVPNPNPAASVPNPNPAADVPNPNAGALIPNPNPAVPVPNPADAAGALVPTQPPNAGASTT